MCEVRRRWSDLETAAEKVANQAQVGVAEPQDPKIWFQKMMERKDLRWTRMSGMRRRAALG